MLIQMTIDEPHFNEDSDCVLCVVFQAAPAEAEPETVADLFAMEGPWTVGSTPSTPAGQLVRRRPAGSTPSTPAAQSSRPSKPEAKAPKKPKPKPKK